jgi:tetratricopeptide (TPR) repeat protein
MWHSAKYKLLVPACLLMLTFQSPSQAEMIQSGTPASDKEHLRAVEMGREGRYDEALSILNRLTRAYPENYPYQRDLVIIAAWKGDCVSALKEFEKIRGATELEPYLVIPVSDCMLERDRPREALTLSRSALKRHPDDPSLTHAMQKATLELKVYDNYLDERNALEFRLATDSDDQGLNEWVGRTEFSSYVAERTRIYGRYLVTRADRAEFNDGNLDRVGLGIRYRFNEQWSIDQELSADLQHSNRGGAATKITHELRDTWKFIASYTTFLEEDLPLRARANNVEASGWQGSAEYNSLDFVWYWLSTVERYHFSDSNRRESFFTTVGYAYSMLPQREQRVYLEWYQSRNSLEGAPYFNPIRDSSPGIVHRTDFIFNTPYKRHVDSLYLFLGDYRQKDFGSHAKWSVKYEQDYDFDDARSFSWGIEFARNIYDGTREGEWRAELSYSVKF